MYVAASRSANAGSGLRPSVLALLTSRSAPPSSSAALASAGAVRRVGHVPGHDAVRSARQALGRGASRSVRRASSTSDQPRSASAVARASPSPCEAPVITATGTSGVSLGRCRRTSTKVQREVNLKSSAEDRQGRAMSSPAARPADRRPTRSRPRRWSRRRSPTRRRSATSGTRWCAAGTPAASIVAVDEASGEVVGHVGLSHAWLDARRELVDVWVLSPLSTRPDRERHGIGSALVAAAIEAARRRGVPALFLEGEPAVLRPARLRVGERPRLRARVGAHARPRVPGGRPSTRGRTG